MDNIKFEKLAPIPKKRRPSEFKRWEEKYANLEKKLASGFSSGIEEVMFRNGYDVTVNPMLYRPSALLRYVVKKACNPTVGEEIDSLFLDAIIKGIFRYGSKNYRYYKDEQLKRIGLRVVLRHITYGPSELDKMYHFDSWAKYMKNKYPEMVKEGIVPENPVLNEFFESIIVNPKSYWVDVGTLFDEVLENLAEYTFNLVQSGKASAPIKHEFMLDLGYILKYNLKPSYQVHNIGHQLYDELYHFISKYYSGKSFEEFEEKGIIEFFNEYLNRYITGDVEEALKVAIEAVDIRRDRRMLHLLGAPENDDGSETRETFKPTSMF